MGNKNKLSAKKIDSIKATGYYNDGGGLWLQVSKSLTKSWVLRFTIDGKRRHMGLGSLNLVSLSEVREKATEYRKMVNQGVDPIERRRAEMLAKRAERDNAVTFQFCAEKFIESHRHGWRNAKHAAQWPSSLNQYVYPIIGTLPVKDIETAHVLRVLEPIWTTRTETASRIRGRIELVLDWSTTRGYRAGDNPARWKGHLENLLPKPSKVKKVNHHAALPYQQMNAFIEALREHDCVSAWALEFLILTAARTGEVIHAKWDEIDLNNAVWTIPAGRMKAGKEHRIPLSSRCIDILNKAAAIRQNDFIFPGGKADKGLSLSALDKLLKTINFDYTNHGFRSSFRDWAGERTNFPRDLCEMALAHTIKDSVEAAYRRGDMLEKRRAMMADWLKFCEQPATKADVLPIRAQTL